MILKKYYIRILYKFSFYISLKLVFLIKITYKKIKNKKGIKQIIIFLRYVAEINFMVVSESTIKTIPIKNVVVFNFE
jgi:hypothetical protein